MNRILLMVMALLAIATGVHAKNHIYGVNGSIEIEGEGYKVFASDRILDTVERIDPGASRDSGAGSCITEEEYTAKNLGDIKTIRSDDRFAVADAKISYTAACATYAIVVSRLKTADDIRKLWLLFGDPAADEFVVETLKKSGTDEEINEEVSLLIESKRLAVVSKYIEFFTKNREWRLSDYTFLSQAFKSRKGKALSPSYIRFIEALLTGNSEKAFQVVASIDIENLGTRFLTPEMRDRMKEHKANGSIQVIK